MEHTLHSLCLRLLHDVSHFPPDLRLNCCFIPTAGRGFHLRMHVGAPVSVRWLLLVPRVMGEPAGWVLTSGMKVVISWLLTFLLLCLLFQNMSENLKDCLNQTQASLGEMVTIKTEACSPHRDQEYGQPWYVAELQADALLPLLSTSLLA